MMNSTTRINDDTLSRLLDAWDTTVLPKHRDGAMQEWMEALRHEFTTCKQEPPISEAGRSSFEEWVKTSHRKRGLSLEKNEKGAYLSNFTNMVWWGWQARGYHADTQNEALVEQR